MKKLLISVIASLALSGVLALPASAVEARTPEPRTVTPTSEVQSTNQANEGEEAGNSVAEIAPTFSLDLIESDHSIAFKFGHSKLLAGNNLTSELSNKSGLMFAAGNNLALRTSAEYQFLAGNIINYAGETTRDLYVAGNAVTLARDAKIGRDVFAAVNTLTVDTDITGDLAVTADTVVLRNVKIAGNLNLTVDHLEIIGQVEVAGAFVYNDNADISGLTALKAGSTEAYHVEEIDQSAIMVAKIYSEILSAAALFLVMALICAFYPRFHDKLETESTTNRFGVNLAVGLGILLITPIIALFAFLTLVAAPLGIIALAIYLIAIYLAQGFAGAWLGHVIIEKLCKAKGNLFIETLLGIVILSLCSVIPYLGTITGLLGLLLGLGLIASCIKPAKKLATPKKNPAKVAKTTKE